jgi:DNA helicase IV
VGPPEQAADPVLTAERIQLDVARRCLDRMRHGAERIADYGVDALASESLGRLRAERLRHLSADAEAPPFFGRTDRDPDAGDPAVLRAHPSGESFHIGRRHIRDDVGDPVVIDWRAPIARPFYRATPTDRMGVRLRRRFGFAADRDGSAVLTSYEDEHLDADENLGLRSDLLRAEIERPRVGPMRDIVATIQPDQDELVRTSLDVSLCIQGAPGTGKTAVGLHRAAYLLYTYPERLRRSGVLVVGPNLAFLRYIAQVLPALGEDRITQTTVEQLVSQVDAAAARREDSAALATLKGDGRMAETLRRAVVSYVAKPTQDVVPIVGTTRYRIPVERARQYVEATRRAMNAGELRWNSARERIRALLAQDVRRQREDTGGAPSDSETAEVARSAPVREFVDRVWPALDPREVLARIYTDTSFAARCGRNVLRESELAALAWPDPPRTARSARFSLADLVLLDELQGLISGFDQYHHVVVDEAQDLSEMQCRAVGRRCPIGSFTVLGDLAQATTPWAPGSWDRTMQHLGHPEAEIQPLTIGYRVPAEVLQVANRLLPFIAADVPPAVSVRSGDTALSYLADPVIAVERCLGNEGSIGVIAADRRISLLAGQLHRAGIAYRDIDQPIAGDPVRVTLIRASAAKGLEFDSVVLVEPADIVEAETSRQAGLRRLYISWTRAVSHLVVVHSQPLPRELTTVAA